MKGLCDQDMYDERNYKTLKYLLLSNNRLRGTVGSQVEQLTALQMLLLHDNGSILSFDQGA